MWCGPFSCVPRQARRGNFLLANPGLGCHQQIERERREHFSSISVPPLSSSSSEYSSLASLPPTPPFALMSQLVYSVARHIHNRKGPELGFAELLFNKPSRPQLTPSGPSVRACVVEKGALKWRKEGLPITQRFFLRRTLNTRQTTRCPRNTQLLPCPQRNLPRILICPLTQNTTRRSN